MTTAAAPNTRYTLQVLSTHSTDSGPAALISFDQTRYLFGAPESLSRVCVQGRVGLRKVGSLFLGALEESAGLPGLVLSTVEAGNRQLEVVGPAGTDHLLASCRFFCRREQLALKVTTPPTAASTSPLSSLPTPIYADQNLIVHALPLAPSAALCATSPASSSASSSSLKRSRSRSSESPSPPPRTRPASTFSADETPAVPMDAEPLPAPSALDISSPGFRPQDLKGADGALWRQMVLADMFRAQDPNDPSATSAPLPRSHEGRTPSYMPVTLPKLGLHPSRKGEVLSYLATGPPLRGKFLVEEAKKRGVVGQACSRLIRGERVWVPEFDEPINEKPQLLPDGKMESKKQAKMRVMQAIKEREKGVVEGEGAGRWVTPEECMSEGQDATAILILNIPSPDYLPSLANIPASLLSPRPAASLRTVLYFLGPGVLLDARLHDWMAALPADSVSHRISSPDIEGNDPVTFVPAALLSLRLSCLSTSMFRLPQYKFLPAPSEDSGPSALLPGGLPKESSLLKNGATFSQGVTPWDPPSAVKTRSFNFAVPSAQAETEAGILAGSERPKAIQDLAAAAWSAYVPAARALAAEIEAEEAKLTADGKQAQVGDDLVVTALGTGSAIPSKYRNVSGTVLHLPDGHYVLMDAGEGTWGQLARRFGHTGPESVEHVLRKTAIIFISHIHQDHHAGLARILRERAKLSPPAAEELTIICPPSARHYLWEQAELFNLGLNNPEPSHPAEKAGVRFLNCDAIEKGARRPVGNDDTRRAPLEALKARLGLKEVSTCPVLHRCRCWGFILEHETGWKTVYSGDTMPAEQLVVAGREATLLVHEATIEDGLEDLARSKGHSTFGQAIDVARRMQARHLLLTHFSARYPKLPPLSLRAHDPASTTAQDLADAPGEQDKIEPVVAVAFDLATMRLDQFWQLEKFRPALDALLGWEEDREEDAQTDAGDSASIKSKRE